MSAHTPRRPWITMQDARVMLIGAGILIASIGGIVLANDIAPRQYPAIIAWLVAALIVHDALIAGAVFAVALAGRRLQERMPFAALLIVQGALAVGAIVALVVVPQILKKQAGTANPSVLPLDYAGNLTIFLIALVAVSVAAIILHIALARQARARRFRS